jgi:predicted Zn finger-like uncharacterized protein
MLIVCPNCATSYRIETASLGASGRSVRCVRCRSVWFAHDPLAVSAIADTYRVDVTAAAGPDADRSEPPPEEAPAPTVETIEIHEIAEEPSPAAEMPPVEGAPPLAPDVPEHDLRPTTYGAMAIADAPALAAIEHGAKALPADAVLEDIETFAARQAKRRAKRRRLHLPMPRLPVTIMALIAINTVLIGWRADVVKILPQTASLYAAIGLPVNLRGLVFADFATSSESQDGVAVLVVEGSIKGSGKRVVEVPRLRFAVRNAQGQEIYAWTALPTRSVLPPGETLAFRSRLASPPPEGHDVTIRFFNRHDRVAGMQ